ncbi:MAG TPA: short-chain dehydrogenase, partial [Erythrobacter sp.]|nr:short-chain dehydrogenase [Erythrobacter sp.]
VSVHVVCPGSVATDVSRNALTADGSKRGRSDKVIDNGIAPNEAAKRIVDAVEANQREIIVAEGVEEAMGELRRTPDQLLDQVAGMVAAGYMDKMKADS